MQLVEDQELERVQGGADESRHQEENAAHGVQDHYGGIQAAAATGALIVAAAGNHGTSTPIYPAAYPEVLSVSAVGPDLQLASYSAYGATVDIAAPDIGLTAGSGALVEQLQQGETAALKLVVHEVQRGDTLFALARRYRQNVKRLMEFNGLTSSTLRIGQKLTILLESLRGSLR